MAYIGAVAPGYDPTRASVPQLDAERFSGDATTTAFTLTRQVVSPTDIDVIVENVTQEPTVAYSVNGYTLTFTGAPGVGTNNIYVVYRGSGISNYAFVPDGSITYAKLANNIKQFTVDAVTANGTGSTVALTEAPASANSIIVSVDGVIQTAPTNYTLSGSTITFTGVPDNGANVVVRHIGFRTTSTVTALQASSVTATEIADGSITNVKIVSVANTKITGNIVSSQIEPGVTLTSANLISATATSGITHRGSTSGTTVLQSSAVASGTLTLPAATDTLVGKATTDTLTNKTLTSPTIATPTMTGQATIPTVNLTGGQIAFPATQSASANANTLDDYEEGTWTPAFTPNGGGSATISSAAGTYVKVGKTVTVYWSLYIASVTGASGSAGIGQLPFTTNDSGGTGANRAAIGIVREDGSTGYAYQWYLNSNGTSGTVLSLTNTGVVWTVGYIYDGSLTYITSA